MEIDLRSEMSKVAEESERSVPPAETFEKVTGILSGNNIKLIQDVKDFENVFWTSELNFSLSDGLPESVKRIRMGGKGGTLEQCLASGIMEFIERWILSGHETLKEQYDCLDLKENRNYIINFFPEILNPKCMASGNNYEEAVLHALHELIETRISLTDYWDVCKLVNIDDLFPDMSQKLKDSIVLIQHPTCRKEFYKFTALQYPFNREFEDSRPFQFLKDEVRIQVQPGIIKTKRHSPNSGGAAGINPEKTAFRAMNEIFQFQKQNVDYPLPKKKLIPANIQPAEKVKLKNYETESITADIRLILNLLGDDVFVGIIDLTDNKFNIPVVKLISDWDPNKSLVSKEVLSVFFNL